MKIKNVKKRIKEFPKTVNDDEPFLLFIHDTVLKTILFAGK